MDTNALTTITTSTSSSSNVNIAEQNMGYLQNPHFPVYGPLSFPATPYHVPHMQFSFPATRYLTPYDHQSVQQFMYSYKQVNQPVVQNGEEAWRSKIARAKRKQALQRSRTSTFEAHASLVPQERNLQQKGKFFESINAHTFCTPDGKLLRDILTKKLKSCDVGSLGRIVLPKRECEKSLPPLHNKKGVQILLKDVYSNQNWNMKFKYWTNSKSRMYVLENTGEFAKYYELQVGDSITLYEDEQKNMYVSVKKQRPKAGEPSSSSSKERQQPQNTYNRSYIHTLYTSQATDEEEEASLALLIEQLSHKKQEAASSLLSLCNG